MGQDLHPRLKEDPATEQRFEPPPGVLPDGLDGPPACPDQYSFLRLAFDKQRRPNVDGVRRFAELLDHRRERIGDFVFQMLKGGLPQVLGHEKSDRLGPKIIARVLPLSVREPGREHRQELVKALGRLGGHVQLAGNPGRRFDQVGLGIGHDDRLSRPDPRR